MSNSLPGGSSIAFVILTWNSEWCIESCLESIVDLGLDKIEVFVVDNGSDDGTLDIEFKVAREHSFVHVLPQTENLGTTMSRNIALKLISPDVDYVCVLDSDTEVNLDALVKLVSALRSDSSIGIVGPSMKNRDAMIQLSGRNLPTLGIKLRKACPVRSVQEKGEAMEVPFSARGGEFQDVDYLLSACWVLPRHVLDTVGLLDERIFYAPEDVDYCLRCHKAGYRIVLCRSAEIVHEYTRLSKKKLVSKINVEHIKGLAYYFKKHGYLFDAGKVLETEKKS